MKDDVRRTSANIDRGTGRKENREMTVSIARCQPRDIESLRCAFLEELNAQFIHDKCHLYGWSDDYLFTIDGIVAGYGCVWGIEKRSDRDTVFEFYVLPEHRRYESALMRRLIKVAGVTTLECQTNDPNTSRLFFENASPISVQSILFCNLHTTHFSAEAVQLVDVSDVLDLARERKFELRRGDVVLATGGLMLNYNPPYADIYMEVPMEHRAAGYGTLIVQELKRVAFGIGRVPVARCRVSNDISKATLIRAGFRPCAYWLVGNVIAG